MKVEKTILEDHQVQLVVEIEPESFNKSKNIAARSLSRKHKIQGFRPGKAPYHMVARTLGEAAILEEAVEKIVDTVYPKLIEEQDITPYGPGQLKEIKELDPPTLEFVVPLAPSVALGEYSTIRKEYNPTEITDKDVDQTVKNILDQQAKTEKVERPAEVGDQVLVSLEAREKGSEEDEEPLINLLRTPAIIEPEDTDTSDEWPFPGFSFGLAGVSADDERNFEHAYDDDYSRDESLTGKTVEFKVAVHEVQARELPELNDEFAKTLGNYETVEDLRADALNHLETQSKSEYDTSYDNELVDEIVSISEISFPPQMVSDEVDALVDQLKNRLGNEGLDFETYLKINDKDEAQLRDEYIEIAERRIRRGLVIMEVAEAEKIQVSEGDVQGDVQRTVSLVQSSMTPRESKKLLNQETMRGLVASAMRDTLTERTFTHLRAMAKGELEKESEEEAAAVEEESDDSPAAEEEAESVKAESGSEEEAPAVEEEPESEETETGSEEEAETGSKSDESEEEVENE